MKRGGMMTALGTRERPEVEGRGALRSSPFWEPGQELTHQLPTSSLYAPGASGSG